MRVKRFNKGKKSRPPKGASRTRTNCTYQILASLLDLEGTYARNKLKKVGKSEQKTTS